MSSAYQPIRGGNASALIHTHSQTDLVRCQRQELLPEQCDPPSTHTCFDETVEDDCSIVCVVSPSIFVTSEEYVLFMP